MRSRGWPDWTPRAAVLGERYGIVEVYDERHSATCPTRNSCVDLPEMCYRAPNYHDKTDV